MKLIQRFWLWRKRLRCKHEFKTVEERFRGVTMSWGLTPTRSFDFVDECKLCGKRVTEKAMIIFGDSTVSKRFYPDGKGSWPRNPETGEKLPTAAEVSL